MKKACTKHTIGDNMITVGCLDHLLPWQQHGAPTLRCGVSRRRERCKFWNHDCTAPLSMYRESPQVSSPTYFITSNVMVSCESAKQEQTRSKKTGYNKITTRSVFASTETGQSVFIWLFWLYADTDMRYERNIIKHFCISLSLTQTPPSPLARLFQTGIKILWAK